jgi:IS1 family transposase
MNVLPKDKQVAVIAALTEGCSIRATERITDVHRDTIMRLGVRIGDGCERLHDAMMRNLQVNLIQMDEQWSFIGKKQKRVHEDDPRWMGDSYVWVALDSTSKAVLTYVVGKRSLGNAMHIANDLRARVLNRPQISTDGLKHYIAAIDLAFGDEADFAQITKTYATVQGNEAAVRYSPGEVISVERTVISGEPDPAQISTSHIERMNLTTRMHLRRFTRLTSGFSKKADNHRAALALHFAWYNLCRVHETLRVTPAMALGVTDHVWTIGELVDAALAAKPAPPLPTPGQQAFTGMSAGAAKGEGRGTGIGPRQNRPRLTIIPGGRR